jgi:hypothetical protein
VAWLLWGGTPAKNFAARKVKQLDAESARAAEVVVDTTDYIGKAAALKAAILLTPLHGVRQSR